MASSPPQKDISTEHSGGVNFIVKRFKALPELPILKLGFATVMGLP